MATMNDGFVNAASDPIFAAAVDPQGDRYHETLGELSLANPCDPDTPEFDVWMRGALRGMQAKDAPTDKSTPAYSEGWQWGQQWRKSQGRVQS